MPLSKLNRIILIELPTSMIPTLGIFMSLNDPQWGSRGGNDGDKPNGGGPRRPNDGPPDLEELWRDFNRKLNGMFGKKGGGGNGGGDGPRMPQIDFNPKFLGGGLTLIAGLVLLSGWLPVSTLSMRRNAASCCSLVATRSRPNLVCAGVFPIRFRRMSW
jgi:hypothetical protein